MPANEQNPELKYFGDIELPQFMGPFFGALEQKMITPEYQDERISAFAKGAGKAILTYPEVQYEISEFVNQRKAMKPLTQANLLQRALIKQFSQSTEYGTFPYGYEDPKAWMLGMHRVMIDNRRTMARDNFIFDLWCRNIQSNKAERYKSIPMLATLYSDRFDGPMSICDLGASRNHGMTKLALGQESPFKSTELYASKQGSERDFVITALGRAIMSGKPLKYGLGADITSIRDPEVKGWARCCSFNPFELLIKGEVMAYDKLDESRPDNVDYVIADAADHDSIARRAKVETFDMVFIGTLLYMISNDEERKYIIKSAEHLVKEDGIVVIQDSVTLNPSAPNGLEFGSSFLPGDYKTLVKDMKSPERGFEVVFQWDGGRCASADVHMDATAVKNFVSRKT